MSDARKNDKSVPALKIAALRNRKRNKAKAEAQIDNDPTTGVAKSPTG